MKHILPLLLLALIPNLSAAQSSYPWNPDFDADGVIGVNDLLAVLAVFESEFEAQLAFTDSSSAILHTGSMDFWDCSATCAELDGNWKVLDDRLAGRYKDEIGDLTDGGHLWLDIGRFPPTANSSSLHFNTLRASDWNVFRNAANLDHHCVCQTRVLVPINLSPTPCSGYIDLCGVCNGPGPIYDCGCQPQPEWACDCEGNQLDALGVCGGNCLGDYNGDGVCDEFAPGVCAGQDVLTYYGEEYDLVEIGGRCWFAEDLKTELFSNGDSIQLNVSNSDWTNASNDFQSGYVVHTEFQINAFLYNWYAVNDSRGLCPSGWHVPSRPEYIALADSVGAASEATGTTAMNTVAQALLDDVNWTGNNSSGFSAVPNIPRLNSGSYAQYNETFSTWTSSSGTEDSGRIFKITTGSSSSWSSFNTYQFNKGYGHVVRCIKSE